MYYVGLQFRCRGLLWRQWWSLCLPQPGEHEDVGDVDDGGVVDDGNVGLVDDDGGGYVDDGNGEAVDDDDGGEVEDSGGPNQVNILLPAYQLNANTFPSSPCDRMGHCNYLELSHGASSLAPRAAFQASTQTSATSGAESIT